MSSSIGHALCGISCCLLAQGSTKGTVNLKGYGWLTGFAILACLPDLDFIAGYIFANNFHQFHSGPSHSILAVFLTTIVLGFALPSGRRLQILPWIFIALASHIVIDLFTGPQLGLHKSYGVFLNWPFHSDRVQMPFSLFYGVRHKTLDTLISWYNIKVIAAEIITFGLLLFFLRSWAHARISKVSVD